MIIPIQREESTQSAVKSCLKSSNKQTSHNTPIPVSVNSNSSSPVPPMSTSILPSAFDRVDDHWKDISALSIFEPRIKRWRRDDIEDFLLPSLGKRSLLKEKFSDLLQPFTHTMNNFAPLLSMNEHPIKIETFNVESDKYVLTLNVNQFKPEELQVKITDTTISVSAKHEDKRDEHNFSCQEFSRSHTLPPGVKPDDVKCELSSDGVLTISAPKPVPANKALHNKETNIPIQHIAPAIRV